METAHYERRAALMKRLIIVCEGPTEHEFCVNVLAPELLKANQIQILHLLRGL